MWVQGTKTASSSSENFPQIPTALSYFFPLNISMVYDKVSTNRIHQFEEVWEAREKPKKLLLESNTRAQDSSPIAVQFCHTSLSANYLLNIHIFSLLEVHISVLRSYNSYLESKQYILMNLSNPKNYFYFNDSGANYHFCSCPAPPSTFLIGFFTVKPYFHQDHLYTQHCFLAYS